MQTREHWSSKTAFVLAAIGSAIGLGNLWRFPYVTYENGGGAFLIAYVICLFIAGIPLLILEFAIGKKFQGGAPKSFMAISPKLQWFGWFAAGVGFVITTYYAGIMSWCVNYFFNAFTLKWGDNPSSFFFDDVLRMTKDPYDFGTLNIYLVIGFIIAWVWIIASIRKGTKTVGKVVYVTVIGPWILLILFVIRGITLSGAQSGLIYYLKPVWSKLLEPAVWHAAISQIFFSLSVGFAIMIAYGSYLHEKTDIVKSALIIGISDALTAFIGGFAIFGALGHMALIKGVDVTEVVKAGPSLTFVTYPELINKLPFAPNLFGVLFFLMLLLLGIDSAFSLVEAVTTAVRDKWAWSHKKANLVVGFVSALVGLIFIFGSGIHWLDITDRFASHFGLTLVVLGECIIVGWYYKTSRIREYINQHTDIKINKLWDICVKFIVPLGILYMLFVEVKDRIAKPYGDFGLRSQEFIFGWGVIILVAIIAVVFQFLPDKNNSET